MSAGNENSEKSVFDKILDFGDELVGHYEDAMRGPGGIWKVTEVLTEAGRTEWVVGDGGGPRAVVNDATLAGKIVELLNGGGGK